jgi:uncharacterized membrane protein
MTEKNLSLERLVFFSDAVVAIAITLLALDLRIDPPHGTHLHFADVFSHWEKFASFFLSFLIIAVFWKIHHEFFYYIRKIDTPLLRYNIGWLLFIVLLPFSTTLVSSYLADKAAILTYSVNVFFITLFQNMLWNYVAVRKEYMEENTPAETIYDFRLSCNIAMINALLAIGISFISPVAAFIILCTRLPMMGIGRLLFKKKRT